LSDEKIELTILIIRFDFEDADNIPLIIFGIRLLRPELGLLFDLSMKSEKELHIS
jgi:hypothetical protein